MPEFLAEVPRTFLVMEAADQKALIPELKKEMGKVVEGYATVEDITGKTVPEAKEAMMASKANLLNKSVTVMSVAKNITMATGGPPYLGPENADIVCNTPFINRMGVFAVGDKDQKADFFSLRYMLGELVKTKK